LCGWEDSNKGKRDAKTKTLATITVGTMPQKSNIYHHNNGHKANIIVIMIFNLAI